MYTPEQLRSMIVAMIQSTPEGDEERCVDAILELVKVSAMTDDQKEDYEDYNYTNGLTDDENDEI